MSSLAYSMTGYGKSSYFINGLEISVEIKSVNHRFLDFTFKSPRQYQYLEYPVKELVSSKVNRGKIDCSLNVEKNAGPDVGLSFDMSYISFLLKGMDSICNEFKIENNIRASDLINNQNIFINNEDTIDPDEFKNIVIKTTKAALNDFVEMRHSEGERLKTDLLSHCDIILQDVTQIELESPQTVIRYKERLNKKISEISADINFDEQRILTEIAIFADKVAIDEEITRLKSHITAFCDLLIQEGPIGKKCDFIVQEMNREANTIASKCQDIDISKIVVNIKYEIEKIREQIQNIE